MKDEIQKLKKMLHIEKENTENINVSFETLKSIMPIVPNELSYTNYGLRPESNAVPKNRFKNIFNLTHVKLHTSIQKIEECAF